MFETTWHCDTFLIETVVHIQSKVENIWANFLKDQSEGQYKNAEKEYKIKLCNERIRNKFVCL